MKELTPKQIRSFLVTIPSTKMDEPMAEHTYLKIGGPARLYYVAAKADEALEAIKIAQKEGIPWYVMGGGSNLLVSDEGYRGLVIQMADRTLEVKDRAVTAAAGVLIGFLARKAAEKGLGGFEWGAGIPGTIGGAVYGNAGCFGGEMKDVTASVEAYDVNRGELVTLSNQECRFGYRDSLFKHGPHVIFSVTLQLPSGNAAESKMKIDEIISRRRKEQPQGAFSAGCLFKNIEYTDDSTLDVLKRSYKIPTEMLRRKRIGAGWLVDKAGLKGTTIGNAQISPAHGNFIVNLGGARAQDILALSSLVKMKVRDEFGMLLENEVQLLGF